MQWEGLVWPDSGELSGGSQEARISSVKEEELKNYRLRSGIFKMMPEALHRMANRDRREGDHFRNSMMVQCQWSKGVMWSSNHGN